MYFARSFSAILYGGTQLTLCMLYQQYWLLQGRSAVKSVLHKCVPCLRYLASTKSQLMGELPTPRVSPSHPFKRAGVDYAGSVKVRLSKSRGKRTFKGYIANFFCMCTRAVQIELVDGYSSEAFIAAFHRFTSWRGQYKHLYKLNQLFIDSTAEFGFILNSLSNLGTEWHFNPPGSPHFGGLWEAAVKSTKHLCVGLLEIKFLRS